MRKRAFVGALLLVTTGCYSYVPVEFDAIPVGQGVRVYLSRDGVARLREIGSDVIPGADSGEPTIQGALVQRTAENFSILVPVASHHEGFLQSELGQQVTLPTSTVVEARLKKVSGVRTGLAVAGSAALITGVVISIMRNARDPLGQNPDPGSQDIRIPSSIR
jgi:hypothetical protein